MATLPRVNLIPPTMTPVPTDNMQELLRLQRAAQRINSVLDLDQLIDRVAEEVAQSMLIARSLFLCCDRSFWQLATRPVGMCVILTAESVVLTCCPPFPLDR